MKRRILIALVLGMLLSLAILTARAQQGEPKRVFMADSRMVMLGPNQVLRMTINWGDGQVITIPGTDGNGEAIVRFRQIGYTQGPCHGGVCTLSMSSQTTSDPMTLAPNQGASMDISPAFLGGVFVGVRGVALSNRRDVQVMAQIVDIVTGQVFAVWVTGPTLPEFSNQKQL